MDWVGDCPETTNNDKADEPPEGSVPDDESHRYSHQGQSRRLFTATPGPLLLLDVKRLQLDHERCRAPGSELSFLAREVAITLAIEE